MMRHLHVRWYNNAYDIVNDKMLQDLIAKDRIREFYRPSERRWVVLGADRIRGEGGSYRGPERRSGEMRA